MPALQSLPYLQQTSGIFFPGNWAKALLSTHKSAEAAQEVEKFLRTDTKCPDNLKNKAREAAWILMKQVPYVEKAKPAVVNSKKKK